MLPTKDKQDNRHSQRGFTLIEVLVVMIILSLLAALVGPKIWGRLGGAKQNAAKTQIMLFSGALDQFRLDVGRYPTTEEGLDALLKNPRVEHWEGPYLAKDNIPKDPWDKPYHYRSPGDHGDFDLYSLGADGQEGGEGENADVTNWN